MPPPLPVILIVAPSGAGKTVLSQRIISGHVKDLSALIGHHDHPMIRYDLKALPDSFDPDIIPIIECATQDCKKLADMPNWKRLDALLSDKTTVIHITLDIPDALLIKRYFFRIFQGPKRLPLWRRVLSFSKYRRLCGYMTKSVARRSTAEWRALGESLHGHCGRILFIKAQDRANDYVLSVES